MRCSVHPTSDSLFPRRGIRSSLGTGRSRTDSNNRARVFAPVTVAANAVRPRSSRAAAAAGRRLTALFRWTLHQPERLRATRPGSGVPWRAERPPVFAAAHTGPTPLGRRATRLGSAGRSAHLSSHTAAAAGRRLAALFRWTLHQPERLRATRLGSGVPWRAERPPVFAAAHTGPTPLGRRATRLGSAGRSAHLSSHTAAAAGRRLAALFRWTLHQPERLRATRLGSGVPWRAGRPPVFAAAHTGPTPLGRRATRLGSAGRSAHLSSHTAAAAGRRLAALFRWTLHQPERLRATRPGSGVPWRAERPPVFAAAHTGSTPLGRRATRLGSAGRSAPTPRCRSAWVPQSPPAAAPSPRRKRPPRRMSDCPTAVWRYEVFCTKASTSPLPN